MMRRNLASTQPGRRDRGGARLSRAPERDTAMRPIFTLHAGEYLVGAHIEQHYKKANVWVPTRDTGVDLLVSDANNRQATSLQVKFSKDFLVTHMAPELRGKLRASGWWSIESEEARLVPSRPLGLRPTGIRQRDDRLRRGRAPRPTRKARRHPREGRQDAGVHLRDGGGAVLVDPRCAPSGSDAHRERPVPGQEPRSDALAQRLGERRRASVARPCSPAERGLHQGGRRQGRQSVEDVPQRPAIGKGPRPPADGVASTDAVMVLVTESAGDPRAQRPSHAVRLPSRARILESRPLVR